MPKNDAAGAPAGKDIAFDCRHCGKSLVIDCRGAGMALKCPECGGDITVPIPEGVDLADLDRLGAVEVQGFEETELQERPSKPAESARLLMTELEELRFRRRFLEKQQADSARGMRELQEQAAAMRAALGKIENILQRLKPLAADETRGLM